MTNSLSRASWEQIAKTRNQGARFTDSSDLEDGFRTLLMMPGGSECIFQQFTALILLPSTKPIHYESAARGSNERETRGRRWDLCILALRPAKATRHQVLVCDPRRTALLKEGNKSDKIDARRLADLLCTGMLRPVYHGEHGLPTLRDLGHSYKSLGQDLNRVTNRIKAWYRGWSIPCAGIQVYAPRYGEEWLARSNMLGCAEEAQDPESFEVHS